MDIETVTVELLRAGPRHNQLVSPITQYLGVCGNSPVSRVTLPYEHGELERRLQELRYGVTAEEDGHRRTLVLEQTGREIAQLLSSIEGVSGTLNPRQDRPEVLTHLRIVLSASELAMLPFETSKVPTLTGADSVWLALQGRAPVCITRHIRSVSAEGVPWPTKPRILFIAGPETPVREHRAALEAALQPWRDRDGAVAHLLYGLVQPRVADIKKTLSEAVTKGAPFTHVHVLAHGAQIDQQDRYSPVALLLNDDEDPITGDRLATALTSVADSGAHRPAVVTLASCDSARQVDLRTTDAALAHDLHDRGIPLVVASQFPLTVEGSIPFVERFYEGLLHGKHPLVTLYDVRLDLHSRMGPDTHDWASLVVYEALPENFPAQLEEACYWQTRGALDGALFRLETIAKEPNAADRAGQERLEALADVEKRLTGLPTRGPFSLECAGLRAAAYKRIAQTAADHALAAGPGPRADGLIAECRRRLSDARAEYWRAMKAFLAPSWEALRRKSNLHWLLGQALSLDVALGQPLDKELLATARLAAKIDLESATDADRAWAHVSMAEFDLLHLAEEGLQEQERAEWAKQAFGNTIRFIEMVGHGSEHVMTTSRQFDRYVTWWGNPDRQWLLAKLGVQERPHWHANFGLVPTAKRLVDFMRGRNDAASLDRPRTTAEGTPGSMRNDGGGSPAKNPTTPRTKPSLAGSRGKLMFAIEMLPAENGDCLWIEYGDPSRPRRILIDCGAVSSARTVASRIESIGAPSERVFELFVLTHIDADHINGVLPLFDNPNLNARFEDIWFNGWHQVSRFLGVKQGEDFSKLLEDPARSLPWNRAITSRGEKYPAPMVLRSDEPPPTFELSGGLRLTLLSPGADQLKRLGREWRQVLLELEPGKAMLGRRRPSPPVSDFANFDLEALASKPVKKDASVANGSSIALLAEFDAHAILLTGDAHAEVLAKSITALQRARGRENEKLTLDALKLSHHGSANATTVELLALLDCPRYLVSSNGNIFYHPDREAMARVILHGGKRPTLCFNYRSSLNELWDAPTLKTRYDYRTEYPREGQAGLRVSL